MAYTVQLKPSNHEFIVAKDETVLEAALRFGLSMQCSCTNGTCGKCKARVLEGEVGEVLHHDYRLTEQEKAAGTVLLCRAVIASDMVMEAVETTATVDIPLQELTATVSKLNKVSDDLLVLEMRTPRSQTLQFLAGQHVTLCFDGVPPRNKSIASCPCNGMVLQFHVHNSPGDEFARFLFAGLKPRQSVAVQGPFGEFVLDEESCRPIIFIAYETGFSPLKSVIEHAIALELAQPMRLYWFAREEGGHYQGNFCRSWQDALDDFKFIPLLPENKAPNSVAQTSAFSALPDQARDILQAAENVVTDYPDLGEFDVYLSGPMDVCAAASALLIKHNLPQNRLFIDDLQKF